MKKTDQINPLRVTALASFLVLLGVGAYVIFILLGQ
jgi:hypothetical protein